MRASLEILRALRGMVILSEVLRGSDKATEYEGVPHKMWESFRHGMIN